MAVAYRIQTSGGSGSPGYLDDEAPHGKQWLVNGSHGKVPEGTLVFPTGNVNTNDPPYWEIEIMEGQFSGVRVWVKSTHLVLVETPPIPQPEPEYKPYLVRLFGRFEFKVELKEVKAEG